MKRVLFTENSLKESRKCFFLGACSPAFLEQLLQLKYMNRNFYLTSNFAFIHGLACFFRDPVQSNYNLLPIGACKSPANSEK